MRWLLLLIMCFPLQLLAQPDTLSIPLINGPSDTLPIAPRWKSMFKAAPLDTNYVKDMSDKLIINPYLISPSMNLRLLPYDNDTGGLHAAQFSPNLRTATGLDLAYKSLYLGFVFRNALTSSDEKRFGQTRYRVTKFVISQRPWVLELYNCRFRGFADRNTPFFDSTLNPDEPYIKRPDINVQYTKAKLIRYFGRGRYSYSSIFSYSEMQKRSKATWMVVGNLGHYKVRADSALLNPLQQPYFGGFADVKGFSVYSMSVGPGFGANIVWEKLFISFMSFYHFDFQVAKLQHARTNSDTYTSSIRTLLEARFAMGYNSEKFFLCFNVKGDSNALGFPQRGSRINYLAVTLDVGYRFNAPGLLDKVYKRTVTRYLGL